MTHNVQFPFFLIATGQICLIIITFSNNVQFHNFSNVICYCLQFQWTLGQEEERYKRPQLGHLYHSSLFGNMLEELFALRALSKVYHHGVNIVYESPSGGFYSIGLSEPNVSMYQFYLWAFTVVTNNTSRSLCER